MRKEYEEVLRGLVAHSDNLYQYVNSLVGSGEYEEYDLKQVLGKLHDEELIAYLPSENIGEIMLTFAGKHYFDEEKRKNMTLTETIDDDIAKCRYHKKKEGSEKLFGEILAKYTGLIPDLEKNLSIIGKAALPGEEFDYRNELNALAAKLEMYLLQQSNTNGGNHLGRKRYDVFISHASKDKEEYVDQLTAAVRRLGIDIFYDTDVISWGDNWKKAILNGTAESEFAVIVISKNYFGREWTEKELKEFLTRQNESGQKIVLPLLLGISLNELKEQYPDLGEIQCISTNQHDIQEIVILLAKELIKRYK